MTTNKVMKLHEFEDAIYYRTACNCGSNDCDMTIELERDKEVDMIFLNMHKDVKWSSYWKSDNFLINMWIRIKVALRVLFNGYIEMEETFIFRGDEQIDAFLGAVKEGRDYLNAEK